MCLECLSEGYIKADTDHTFSLLFEKDAVEYIYKVVSTGKHEYSLYQLSSNDVVSELELAAMVQEHMADSANIVTSSGGMLPLCPVRNTDSRKNTVYMPLVI